LIGGLLLFIVVSDGQAITGFDSFFLNNEIYRYTIKVQFFWNKKMSAVDMPGYV
jgi:hypothetical protein